MINDAVGGTSVVLVGRSATRTARAYERGSRTFRLGGGPDELVEQGSGEVWRVEEEALVHPGSGCRLPRLAGHNAFWFGWFAFHPETAVYGH